MSTSLADRAPERSMLVRCALGHKLAARPQLVERRPHPSGRDEIPLAFVQRERIPEVTDSLVAPPGQYADVTEVAERVRVPVEHLRLATEVHGLPGKTLPFGKPSGLRQQRGAHLSPEHVREDVVARRELLRLPRRFLRLLQPAESEE